MGLVFSNWFNTKFIYFNLVIIYCVSRLLIFSIEVIPDPERLPHMMQLLDVKLLENYFLESIYYLHYQPPIWNIIFGLLVKIFGQDYLVLSKALYFLNLFFSLLIIYVFVNICRFFSLSVKEIYLTYFLFFIFDLSFLFYESYNHYTHLTVLLYSLLVFFYFRFTKKFDFKYEIYIYSVAILLVYTWSAFSHPLFVVLIFFTFFIIKNKKNLMRSFLIFIIFLTISLLPSIKNKIEFGLFANSSWIGLQIVQVLKRYDIQYPLCSMKIKEKNFEVEYIKSNTDHTYNHPSLIGKLSKYNNIGMIYKTKKCLKIGIDLIKKDPLDYLNKVKFNFISTHGHFSIDHGFKPKNWNKYFGFVDNLKDNFYTNKLKVRSLQLYYLFIYIFFSVIVFKSLLNFNNSNFLMHKSISSIFLIFSWMIIGIHLGAGFEQERMRHLGHFMHIIFFILLIKHNFNPINIIKNFK